MLLNCFKKSILDRFMCALQKRTNSINSRTGNLKKRVVKIRLSLYIWIVALSRSIFSASMI